MHAVDKGVDQLIQLPDNQLLRFARVAGTGLTNPDLSLSSCQKITSCSSHLTLAILAASKSPTRASAAASVADSRTSLAFAVTRQCSSCSRMRASALGAWVGKMDKMQ